jgi:hypothetical protein
MDLMKKLNYKGQHHVFLLNKPASLSLNIEEKGFAGVIADQWDGVESEGLFLIFVFSQDEIHHWAEVLLPVISPKALLWLAYPKLSSKLYHSDVSRDRGWNPFTQKGWRPVRQIAIDEDWSSLRFRPNSNLS